jgi:hypothetical protein
MSKLLEDLQLFENKTRLIINAPETFLQLLKENELEFHTDIEESEYDIIVVFGISNEEIMELSSLYLEFISEKGLVWLCYPKVTSLKYPKTNCNWDTVSLLLKEYGLNPLEKIEIDEDFLAISFKNNN